MNRRILESRALNLATYPDEPIYVPDMLVAIVALHNYGSKYQPTVHKWLVRAKLTGRIKRPAYWCHFWWWRLTNWWCSGERLLLCVKPLLSHTNRSGNLPCRNMNCWKHFMQNGLFAGLKEYHDESCWLGTDIDVGSIIFNLSPSGKQDLP